jgi:Flp pilus assembly protein TadG
MSRAVGTFLDSGRAPAIGSAKPSSVPRGLRLLARMHRTLRAQAGSSIVEFAMVSSILFSLVFGLLAICMALYTYNVVAEIAREATRYAIVRGSACSIKTFSNCNIDQSGLQTHVQGIGGSFPGITPSSLTVTASAISATGTICTPTLKPCNKPGNPVKVTVTYAFPLVIPFVPRRTLTMSSTSQMTISQ